MKKLYFTLVELIVVVVIAMIIIGIMLFVGIIVAGGCWMGSKAHKEGVKPAVERIWEGPKKDTSSDSEISNEIN